LPTLQPDKAKTLVSELLKTNAGCQLPCWWGITPGKTSWQEANQFLGVFARAIDLEDRGQGYQIGIVQISSPIDVPYITTLNQTYGIRDGIIETIDTYNYELATWYDLPNILNIYGRPDEIGITTFHKWRWQQLANRNLAVLPCSRVSDRLCLTKRY
jgi:hypothetical protein